MLDLESGGRFDQFTTLSTRVRNSTRIYRDLSLPTTPEHEIGYSMQFKSSKAQVIENNDDAWGRSQGRFVEDDEEKLRMEDRKSTAIFTNILLTWVSLHWSVILRTA